MAPNKLSLPHDRATSSADHDDDGHLLHMHADAARPAARATPDQAVVGANVARLRQERGYALDELAALTGASTETLIALEAGREPPTIELLWQLAKVLGVRFSALVQAAAVEPQKGARAPSPSAVRRSLIPGAPDAQRRTEVHELRLPAHARERAARAPSGMFETLLVTKGSVLVEVDAEAHLLEPGDALSVPVESDRTYVNPGDRDAVIFAMISPSPRA